MHEQTFAIIGASLAGVRAAETLRSEGFEGRVILIGDERHLPYDRPPLSKKVLTGETTPESTTLRDATFYDGNQIELVLGSGAVALRPASREIELANGTKVVADKVLLATGGRASRLNVPGSDLDGVHVLRSMDDAVTVSAALKMGPSVVVIGAGFIGAEVAASARQVGCDVTMIESAPIPLSRVLGPEIGERYAAEHRRHGVHLFTGLGVDHIAGQGRVRSVVATDGTEFPADLVVVGVGIQPNVELAAGIGLMVDNGIVVDELCATANPAVFAAGDVANHPSLALGRRVRHEQWQHASDHGAAAAKSMLGKGEPYGGVLWFWSDQYNLNLQMAGHPDPGDHIVWRGDLDSENFCAFYLSDGQLTGAVGVNRPKDVRAVMMLMAAGLSLSPEQLADPSVDIRKTGFAAAL
jgi:3-phenylpropionate/trans-cinnamate dioxygenase ferredoxin reductase subunit